MGPRGARARTEAITWGIFCIVLGLPVQENSRKPDTTTVLVASCAQLARQSPGRARTSSCTVVRGRPVKVYLLKSSMMPTDTAKTP